MEKIRIKCFGRDVDHGSSFPPRVNLNLVVSKRISDLPQSPTGAEWFHDVTGRSTYAVGLGSVYLNLGGARPAAP